MIKKILTGLLLFSTMAFGQTPDGTYKGWYDSLFVDDGGTFMELKTFVQTYGGGQPEGIDSTAVEGIVSDTATVLRTEIAENTTVIAGENNTANNPEDTVKYLRFDDRIEMRNDTAYVKSNYPGVESIDTTKSFLKDTYLFADTLFGLSNLWQGPSAWRHRKTNDRTYFNLMAYPTYNGVSYRNYVMYYDFDTDSLSAPVQVPTAPSAADAHILGLTLVTDEGNVVSIQDSVYDAGHHNKGMQVSITSTPEDISTFVDHGLVDPACTGSYPSGWKMPNGDLYLLHRYGLASGDHYRTEFHKSTDNGLTWTVGKLVTTFENSNDWAYPGFVTMEQDTNKFGFTISRRNMADEDRRWMYFLWTRDGTTWYNLDMSYSTDITSAPIGLANMNSYYCVDSLANPGYLYAARTTMYKDKLYYMKMSAPNEASRVWSHTAVIDDGTTAVEYAFTSTDLAGYDSTRETKDPMIYPVSDEVIYVIVTYFDTDGDSRAALFVSTDNNLSYTKVRELFPATGQDNGRHDSMTEANFQWYHDDFACMFLWDVEATAGYVKAWELDKTYKPTALDNYVLKDNAHFKKASAKDSLQIGGGSWIWKIEYTAGEDSLDIITATDTLRISVREIDK